MTTVLREVRNAGVLDGFPRVSAYRERCEARPAWRRTLEAYEQRLGAPAGSALAASGFRRSGSAESPVGVRSRGPAH
jgi:hypothetical protein